MSAAETAGGAAAGGAEVTAAASPTEIAKGLESLKRQFIMAESMLTRATVRGGATRVTASNLERLSSAQEMLKAELARAIGVNAGSTAGYNRKESEIPVLRQTVQNYEAIYDMKSYINRMDYSALSNIDDEMTNRYRVGELFKTIKEIFPRNSAINFRPLTPGADESYNAYKARVTGPVDELMAFQLFSYVSTRLHGLRIDAGVPRFADISTGGYAAYKEAILEFLDSVGVSEDEYILAKWKLIIYTEAYGDLTRNQVVARSAGRVAGAIERAAPVVNRMGSIMGGAGASSKCKEGAGDGACMIQGGGRRRSTRRQRRRATLKGACRQRRKSFRRHR